MKTSTAALVRSGRRLLFIRRPPGGALSECWELPGGKVDPGETPEEALQRELREELRVDAVIGAAVGESSFTHDGIPFRLIGYLVVLDTGRIELVEHSEAALLTPEEAARRNLAPSDRSLLEAIGELT